MSIAGSAKIYVTFAIKVCYFLQNTDKNKSKFYIDR